MKTEILRALEREVLTRERLAAALGVAGAELDEALVDLQAQDLVQETEGGYTDARGLHQVVGYVQLTQLGRDELARTRS